MDKEQLVDLAAFRKRNGLKQEELAQMLGVHRSYISQVETGSCKISADKMKKLWEISKTEQWFMDDLVPALDRLNELFNYVWVSLDPYNEYAPKGERYDPEREVMQKKFETEFSKVVTPTVRESIALGQTGIDATLADRILAIVPPRFSYDKEWLMTGECAVSSNETSPERTIDGWGPLIESERVYPLLETVLQKQEELERMVKEIKDLLLNKA